MLEQLECCAMILLHRLSCEVQVPQAKLPTGVASVCSCLEVLPGCVIVLIDAHSIGVHVTQMGVCICITPFCGLPANITLHQ